jgi:hypothetical protein
VFPSYILMVLVMWIIWLILSSHPEYREMIKRWS